MRIECADRRVTSTPNRAPPAAVLSASRIYILRMEVAAQTTTTSMAATSSRCRRVSQLDFLPPLRPAAAFWARLPPLPLPLLWRLRLLPLLLPPRLEEPSELEIAAARDLLMPFLRRPSYCLSFFTLDP